MVELLKNCLLDFLVVHGEVLDLIVVVHLMYLVDLFLVEGNNGDQMAEFCVNFDTDMVDKWCILVDSLKLQRRNILTILKLLVFMNSIDDLKGTVRKHGDEISNLEPPFFIKNSGGEFRILEVALHNTISFNEKLTSWIGCSGIGIQFWYFSNLHSNTWEYTSNVTRLSVPRSSACTITSRLSLSVSFKDRSREGSG